MIVVLNVCVIVMMSLVMIVMLNVGAIVMMSLVMIVMLNVGVGVLVMMPLVMIVSGQSIFAKRQTKMTSKCPSSKELFLFWGCISLSHLGMAMECNYCCYVLTPMWIAHLPLACSLQGYHGVICDNLAGPMRTCAPWILSPPP